ncbi:PREDICTED: uncharacterized protein LOC109461661 [Branchiostoma belcheri]|uniref:Uncharacterized protein LOC109461661 n=1 Tax=Branchiostoma belcheri TaxID=7741 RepID=A0A6P4XAY0_BRABE|nr:PREDICTED: uncharacterized protein LOC109461661 [Branchiostoma belcheri]
MSTSPPGNVSGIDEERSAAEATNITDNTEPEYHNPEDNTDSNSGPPVDASDIDDTDRAPSSNMQHPDTTGSLGDVNMPDDIDIESYDVSYETSNEPDTQNPNKKVMTNPMYEELPDDKNLQKLQSQPSMKELQQNAIYGGQTPLSQLAADDSPIYRYCYLIAFVVFLVMVGLITSGIIVGMYHNTQDHGNPTVSPMHMQGSINWSTTFIVITGPDDTSPPILGTNQTSLGDTNGIKILMLQVSGHNSKNGTLETLSRRLKRLHTLVLGPGNIRTVVSGVFEGHFLNNLKKLSMNRNCIHTVGNWFVYALKLRRLHLSWNEIKKDALQPLKNLFYLELAHNQLSVVKEWHFDSLTGLKYLKLSYNNISHIAGKSFNNLTRLAEIYLDHNKLAHLDVAWLQGMPRGTHVYLQNNLVQTISAESLCTMIGKFVYIENNPFRCTCALDSLKSKGPGVVQDYQSLQCSYPPSLLGRKIANVMREMLCPSPTVKVSHQDNGATLVCEVFWEQQPAEIQWFDPDGRDIREKECLGTDDLPYHTATNTTTPSRGQEAVFTEKIIFLNTLEKIPGKQQDGIATLSYIIGACLALFLLGGAMAACHKGYRRRQERQRVPGNAANASGDTPLQNSQQQEIGNPATPQPADEKIPDVNNTDLDVCPYATTVDMANPMYNITPTETKGLRSIQDPPPLPNRQTINNPSSQPQGMEMSHTGDIPALPPRTHRHINYNPSTQSQGMEAGNIPASPPPNTNRHSNYNASACPQSSDITQMGKIQDLPPRSNRTIPYGASSKQSSEIPPVHEIQDPTPRSKRHINSTGASSQAQGLQIQSGEEIPDLPPRSNKYVNSSVPSQQ